MIDLVFLVLCMLTIASSLSGCLKEIILKSYANAAVNLLFASVFLYMTVNIIILEQVSWDKILVYMLAGYLSFFRLKGNLRLDDTSFDMRKPIKSLDDMCFQKAKYVDGIVASWFLLGVIVQLSGTSFFDFMSASNSAQSLTAGLALSLVLLTTYFKEESKSICYVRASLQMLCSSNLLLLSAGSEHAAFVSLVACVALSQIACSTYSFMNIPRRFEKDLSDGDRGMA